MKTDFDSIIILCVLAALSLSCESAHHQLNSVNDLKTIDFGQSVPRHSLLLLHWFANQIDINEYTGITLNFDPNTDLGSHHYGNFEGLLQDPLPRGYRYYTIGNLNEDFPAYLCSPPVRQYKGKNLDRIVVSAISAGQHSRSYRIHRVYLTQHIPGTREYDPTHTYQITTNLLQQIRQFSRGTHPRCGGSDSSFTAASATTKEDFGSHHYGNYEHILDPLPPGYRYYTVGNLHEVTSDELPDYVLNPPVREYVGTNMDRIIFRVQERTSGDHRIDQVYLTQHYRQDEHQGTRYNPEYTYRISTTLLHELRLFSVEYNPRSMFELTDMYDSSDSQLQDISDSWGERLVYLGLLVFIVIQENYSTSMSHRQQQPAQNKAKESDDTHEASNFTLKLDILNDRHEEDVLVNEPCQEDQGGTFVEKDLRNQTDSRVQITGYDAHLELVEKQQSVCARLYVKDDFTQWTFEFKQSWVGFYKSAEKGTDQYEWGQWQWTTRFMSCSYSEDYNENCLEYCSNMEAASGVQARFIVKHNRELARTPSFQTPGGVEITGFNAHLEYFAENGKACARIYVRKSFRHWRSEFERSWVGFYTSARTDKPEWWQGSGQPNSNNAMTFGTIRSLSIVQPWRLDLALMSDLY
ncbi:hypothetical protein WMY93_003605 [Mugilogobius chulae]|uniref:Uncharacterized protein n=1 Tax=Mugilogobius chulae TaxID=88201 RepID=A0AAW0Q015_9GOBI